MEHERRRAPRFPFIAAAEILGDESGRLISNTRVSDLSLSGCYVDTISPLPHGTEVRVKIFTETQSFEAPATVAYSQLHLGMGLAFGEVKPNSLDVLQNWLPAERPGAQVRQG